VISYFGDETVNQNNSPNPIVFGMPRG